MGSVGDCFDNAMAESFFATLECELLDRTTLSTHAEARAALFEFIEGWYNTRRRHSALGYRSPLEFERLHQAGAVDGARPVDALRAPTSPLDPALRTGSTPPTGINVGIRLAGDSSINTGINSRNRLGTLEVPNGNGAVSCIGSIGASPLRVTIPAWVGRS